MLKSSNLLVLALALLACGPKPTPNVIPVLPGDGDSNVVNPDPVPVKEVPIAPPDPWSGRKDLIAAPTGKSEPITLPPRTQFTLPNGLQVIALRNPTLPVVSFQLAVRAGRSHEPLARHGIAELTGDLLIRGGTKKRSAEKLITAVESIGGSMSINTGYEATIISCSVLATDRSTCANLISDVVTNPAFTPDAVNMVWQNKLAELGRRLQDPDQIATLHAQNLLWGDAHVRGWAPSEAKHSGITREDVRSWHRAWFAPNNAILVVTGDFEPAALKALVQQNFGSWKKSTLPPVARYAKPEFSGVKIRLVDMPGARDTKIRIGQFGIAHDDIGFFDALVWNQILGGEGDGRLAKLITKDGGGGRASSAFDRNADQGSLVISAVVKSSVAVAKAKVLLDEVAKMHKEGPSAAEVSAATQLIAGAYGSRFAANADIGAAVLGAELHGFNENYTSAFADRILAVTAESAKASAQRILDPANFVIVLVGDAKDLEPGLKQAGWKYDKVSFTDAIGPETTATLTVDANAQKAAALLLEEALAAKGGESKLRAVKAMRIRAAGSSAIGPQNAKIEMTRTIVQPDKMRVDAVLTLPTEPKPIAVTVAIDGKKAWNLDPGGLSELPAKYLPAIEFERWRDPEFVLLRHKDKDTVAELLGDEKVDGKPNAVIRVATKQGFLVQLWIDRQTKLLTRLAYEEVGVVSADQFGDYKEVAGLKIAHKRTSTVPKTAEAPARTTTLTVSSVEVDPTVGPGFFAVPRSPNPAAPPAGAK